MGRPKKEDLLLFKWRYYFKSIMESMNASKIKTSSLVDLAMVNPSGHMLYDTMENGIVMANKAIESIKNGDDPFLKYDSKLDAIVQVPIDGVEVKIRKY